MRNVVFAGAAALALVSASPGALAQDSSKTATYGEIVLHAGFTPDPYRVSVTAGGAIDAYKDTPLPAACVGNEAGRLPLVFRTLSSVDTTLIINGPDGNWSCDDDSYGDGDAQVRFDKPRTGTYDVWIGTFGGGTANATLLITETP